MTNTQNEKARHVAWSAWLGRPRINLPNFLPSTLPVAAMAIIARWFYCDTVIACLSVTMLGLHALSGLADIMANHYRAKLLKQTSYDLALAS